MRYQIRELCMVNYYYIVDDAKDEDDALKQHISCDSYEAGEDFYEIIESFVDPIGGDNESSIS